jgi:hypothetical protein
VRADIERYIPAALARRIIGREGTHYVVATSTLARYDDAFLLGALVDAMDSGYEYTRDDLAHLLATYLGFRRIGQAMRERVEAVSKAGVKRGVLAKKGKWVWRTQR